MKFPLTHERGAVLSIATTDGRVSLVLSSEGDLVTAFDLTPDEASQIAADLIGSAIEVTAAKRFAEYQAFRASQPGLFEGISV